MEFIVGLSLALAGSFVGLSAHLGAYLLVRNSPQSTIATGLIRGASTEAARSVDPVVAFALTLISYGLIALALPTALPGPLVLERTGLTFAYLCVGGLVGEISTAGSTARAPLRDDDSHAPIARKPISLRLSVALMLVFNLSFAVLISGRGLIQIVPPVKSTTANYIQELEPMLVVARRTHDPLEDHSSPF